MAWGATPDDCHALRKHGHLAEAQKCYESLTTTRDPYLRAEGYWGTEKYQEANNQFRIAVDKSPANAMYRVRWGRLMHERFNYTDAANLFQEALERDPKIAQAYYGLALVSADGFDNKAIEYVEQGDGARSQANRSPRADGQFTARRFRRSESVRGGGRGAQDFFRGARRHGHPRRHPNAGRPLPRRMVCKNVVR